MHHQRLDKAIELPKAMNPYMGFHPSVMFLACLRPVWREGDLLILEPMPSLVAAFVCSVVGGLHVLEPMPPLTIASMCPVMPPRLGQGAPMAWPWPWPPIFLNYSTPPHPTPTLKSYLSLLRVFCRRHHRMLRRHNRIITQIIIKLSKPSNPKYTHT